MQVHRVLSSYILILLTVFVFVSCSPSLGSRISLGSPGQGRCSVVTPNIQSLKVSQVTDAREQKTIAIVDGKSYEAEGEVTGFVLSAIWETLKSCGIKESAFAAELSIEVQLVELRADVSQSFPLSTIEAFADIKIYRSSTMKEDRRIEVGNYRSQYEVKYPIINDANISDALGTALSEALTVGIGDTIIAVTQ